MSCHSAAEGGQELRSALQEITEDWTAELVGEQVAAVSRLGLTLHHSVKVVRPVDLKDVRSWRFNCHAFAFGLSTQDVFCDLQVSHPNAWPDSGFVVNHLLPLTQSVEPEIEAGTGLVLYWRHDQLKHSGITEGTTVRSKWGDCHTWEHGLMEVPASYGDRVAYHRAPARDMVSDAYVRFAGAA